MLTNKNPYNMSIPEIEVLEKITEEQLNHQLNNYL